MIFVVSKKANICYEESILMMQIRTTKMESHGLVALNLIQGYFSILVCNNSPISPRRMKRKMLK